MKYFLSLLAALMSVSLHAQRILPPTEASDAQIAAGTNRNVYISPRGAAAAGFGTGGIGDGDKGDIIISGSGANFVLDNSGASAGTYGGATVVPVITVDAKGRITSVSNVTITAGSGNVTATGALDGNVMIGRGGTSIVSLASQGNDGQALVSAGPGQDPLFGVVKPVGGGTGVTSFPAGSIITGNSVNALTNIAPGSVGNVISSNGTAWIDSAPVGNVTNNATLATGNIIIGGGTSVVGTSTMQWNATNSTVTIGALGAGNIIANVITSTTFNATTMNVDTLNVTNDITVPVGGTGAGTFTANSPLLGNTTGALKQATGITTDGTSVVILGVDATTAGGVKLFGGTSGNVTIAPTAAAGAGVTMTVPAATDTFVGKATTDTFTNKTFDASGTGNVFKAFGFIVLTQPHVYASGVTQQTTVTSRLNGQALFSNSTDKATNYVEYVLTVPPDIDTAVDLTAKLSVSLGGADTGDHEYEISMVSIAASSVYDTAPADAISLGFTADGSGADKDVEQTAETTLTGWKSAVTAGAHWVIRVARDGDHANDTSTVNSYSGPLVIKYGITQ